MPNSRSMLVLMNFLPNPQLNRTRADDARAG